MTLTKSMIIEDMVKIGLNSKKAADLMESLLEIIKKCLENGDDILISGFGKFRVREKRKRRGRNPITGDSLILSERRVVTFSCSPVLRNKIN